MSKSYLNKVELKHGQIILFHRQNSKKPIYHVRIHVKGMRDVYGKNVTYVQESTGETDLEEAKRYALDRYDDLRLRTKSKAPVKQLTFADLYALWWTDKRQRLEASYYAKGRKGDNKRVGWYEKHSKRYWLPYFGSAKLEEMTQAYVQGYWTWRMTYWANVSDEQRKAYANHALTPAKKSMDMEQSALREVFNWAIASKLLTYKPIIENPYTRQGIAPTRRPSFSPDEYMRLQEYMRRWVEGQGDNDKRVNSAHRYNRQLLKHYITWLAETGMRTGEALQLRHKDISIAYTESNKPHLLITVPKDTKTGTRLVRSHHFLNIHYEELRRLTGLTEPDDWVFCNKDGTRNDGFYKTLPKLFNEAGVLLDEHGNRRTAYSLRHYYAEERLRDLGFKLATYDMIATNMGTSRTQIENHYVRKGLLMDVDTLLTTRAASAPKAVTAVASGGIVSADKRRAARARRKGAAQTA